MHACNRQTDRQAAATLHPCLPACWRPTPPLLPAARVRAGDKRLFIRADELEAAWNVFTPVLHEIEHKQASHRALHCH